MIVDGREIAKEILTDVRARVDARGHAPVVRAVTVSPNAATRSYLKIKTARAKEAGMLLEVVELAIDATTEEVIGAVQNPGADAVIVQLPLPPHITQQIVVDSIPLTKDADVLNSTMYARFERGEEGALLPPVVGAIKKILENATISIQGARVAVVGKGKLVGEPTALWLKQQGSEVVVFDKTSDLSQLQEFDIIISGTGQAGMITPSHIKKGVVLIDAGTSESAGSIVGDADPRCADVASLFTPVPGGVGPVAVACLFKNVAALLEESPI